MDVANASMYDGGSALAEAVLMARAIKGKGDTVVLSSTIHPLYREVVKTYLYGYRDNVEEIPFNEEGITDLNRLEEVLKTKQVHALAVQYPNFFGFVEPLEEISRLANLYGVPLIVVTDPVALAVLKPPGDFNADIVVGEGQQLGIPLSFGGPYLGFFCHQAKVRQKDAGPVGRNGRGCKRQKGFYTGSANEGTAHKEGKGYLKHLFQPEPYGTKGADIRSHARQRGSKGGCKTIDIQSALSLQKIARRGLGKSI
jgi:glycine dehydrogenase subunit 1